MDYNTYFLDKYSKHTHTNTIIEHYLTEFNIIYEIALYIGKYS